MNRRATQEERIIKSWFSYYLSWYSIAGNVAFFGLYSLASISAVFINDGLYDCRGGFGGADVWLSKSFSDFGTDTSDDERHRLEFLFVKKLLLIEEIGNVDEPFVGRLFRRLDTLDQ